MSILLHVSALTTDNISFAQARLAKSEGERLKAQVRELGRSCGICWGQRFSSTSMTLTLMLGGSWWILVCLDISRDACFAAKYQAQSAKYRELETAVEAQAMDFATRRLDGDEKTTRRQSCDDKIRSTAPGGPGKKHQRLGDSKYAHNCSILRNIL